MPQQYDKLVRDRIPEIIRRNGDECVVEVMGEEDYRHALRRKLVEEATEASEASPVTLITELADLYEVIDALLTAEGLDHATLHSVQAQRRAERGGFAHRLRLLCHNPRATCPLTEEPV